VSERICYNFHNLITAVINRGTTHSLFDPFNLKFSFFQAKMVENPDIILNVREFQPQKSGEYSIDHKYSIEKNYFFCSESSKNASWKLEIINLDEKVTTINVSCSMKGLNSIMYPDFFPQNILLKVIEYKLFLKGYFLVHGASVSKNGNSYVLLGRGGSFKTSICMDLIRNEGYSYQGDDRVIIGPDQVYAFPMNLNVFAYMIGNLKNENGWGIVHKLRCFLLTQRGKIFSCNVVNAAKIKKIFVIQRVNKKGLGVNNLSRDQYENILLFNNRLEDFIDIQFLGISNAPVFRYFLSYLNVYPDSQLNEFLTEFGNKLHSTISGKQIQILEIPRDYSPGVAEMVSMAISNE